MKERKMVDRSGRPEIQVQAMAVEQFEQTSSGATVVPMRAFHIAICNVPTQQIIPTTV